MREINKQASAEEDLMDIWLFTFNEWGSEQADHYLDSLGSAIEKLRNHPKLGADCSHVKSGYRRLGVLHHKVYYFLTDSSVEIVRVLHERTDEDYQFGENSH